MAVGSASDETPRADVSKSSLAISSTTTAPDKDVFDSRRPRYMYDDATSPYGVPIVTSEMRYARAVIRRFQSGDDGYEVPNGTAETIITGAECRIAPNCRSIRLKVIIVIVASPRLVENSDRRGCTAEQQRRAGLLYCRLSFSAVVAIFVLDPESALSALPGFRADGGNAGGSGPR